jgi:O-antigen biosynthesis protein WbqV
MSRRALIAFGHDLVMAVVSFLVALTLRLGPDTLTYVQDPEIWKALTLFTLVCAGVFWMTGLYRGIWRYASTQDMINIVRAVTLALLIFLPVTFLVTRLELVPRSVLVIDWLVLIFLLGAPRMLYRVWKDRGLVHLLERGSPFRVPVLLVGPGDSADLFIRETTSDPNNAYRVVGILDEKGTRVGRNIRGVQVMGSLDDLDRVVETLRRRGQAPQRLILTRRLKSGQLSALLEQADAHGMALARLPRLTEFKAGDGDGARRVEPRPVAVEDLLRRPQASLDRAAMARLVAGNRVLVTGAGGSIGSELVRQVADFGPRRLVLLDNSEYLLYRIDLQVAERAPQLDRRAVLADVRDAVGVARVFGDEAPDLVLHAAAIKHVPLAEDNPIEAILTNLLGTRNVADACRVHRARTMVQISTDKAINPTSVMGATKRLAESYAQACDLAERGAQGSGRPGTRFVTVRFGNVLGSTGSVVPLFSRQIERGGPVTVTHPEMTRYFMTVGEAVQLVMQASALGADGQGADEVGKIYVLDMGEPVKIDDLARQMIRLAGLRPGKDVRIVYTGARPGEKLHEELFHGAEPMLATRHPSLRLAAARTANLEILKRVVDEIETAARAGREADALRLLRGQVPEYARAAARAADEAEPPPEDRPERS